MTENESIRENEQDSVDDIFDKSKNPRTYRTRNIIIYLIPVLIFAIIWAVFLISSSVKASSYDADNFEFTLISKENRVATGGGDIVRVGVKIKNNSKHDALRAGATLSFKNGQGDLLFQVNGTFTAEAEAGSSYDVLIDLSSSSETGLDALLDASLEEITLDMSDTVIYYSDFKTSENAGNSSKVTKVVLGIATAFLLVIWVVIIFGFRCPNCGSLFTLRIAKRVELSRREASWQETQYRDGVAVKVRVKGEEITYNDTKKCKCCDHVLTTKSTQRVKY